MTRDPPEVADVLPTTAVTAGVIDANRRDLARRCPKCRSRMGDHPGVVAHG